MVFVGKISDGSVEEGWWGASFIPHGAVGPGAIGPRTRARLNARCHGRFDAMMQRARGALEPRLREGRSRASLLHTRVVYGAPPFLAILDRSFQTRFGSTRHASPERSAARTIEAPSSAPDVQGLHSP